MRDIVSKWGTLRNGMTVPAKLTTATNYGDPIDVSGYNGCVFYVLFGAYTDGTHRYYFVEADDDPTTSTAPTDGNALWTAIPDNQLVAFAATSGSDYTPTRLTTDNENATPNAFSVTSAAATQRNYRVGYMGKKKWVQIVCESSAASTGSSFTVVVGLGEPRFMPAAV